MQNMLDGSVAATASETIQLQRNAIPKVTTTARNALSGTDIFAGLLVYNTTTNKLNLYNGTAWEVVTSA